MKILVLGGTGVMEKHLIKFLSENNDVQVTDTSRKVRINYRNVHYVVLNM